MYHSDNKEELEEQIKNDLETYSTWLKGQKFIMNLTKTNYIIFNPKRKLNIDINLGDKYCSIKRVKCTKYLGVFIDENLSWEQHIDNLKKKIVPMIGAFRRCPKFPVQISKIVYNAHVLSKIRSSILIWSICCENYLNEIQVLMNRALKI